MNINRYYLMIGILFFIAKIWLVQAHSLIGIYSPHDNLLFIRLANNILSGEWLGTYNQLTLIKGPFYPIFIALCWWLCVPLLAAQQILFGVACFALIIAINPLVQRKGLLLILFLLLLFNPFSYNYPMVGRVYRLGIYPSLSLMIFSTMFGLYIRFKLSMNISIIWAIVLGIAFTSLWHTREESVWILPSLMLIVSIIIIRAVSNRSVERSKKILLITSIPFLIWLGCTLTLNTINWIYYGIFNTIEIKTKEFTSAYDGLMRINPEKFRQHYLAPRDVRQKAYKVSPTLRKIQVIFENDIAPKWESLLGTDDIPAGWFIWAFRDAVAKVGNFNTASDALTFYQQIGYEIEKACNTGELDCNKTIIPLMPPWRDKYNRQLWSTFLMVLQRIISFDDFSADTEGMRSSGSIRQLVLYDIVTREKLLPSRHDNIEIYPEYHIDLNQKKVTILNTIGWLYQKSVPILFLSALIFYLGIVFLSIYGKRFYIFTIFSTSVLIGIISNVAILSIVNITTGTPIIRPIHTCYPLILLFVVTSFVDCLAKFKIIDFEGRVSLIPPKISAN